MGAWRSGGNPSPPTSLSFHSDGETVLPLFLFSIQNQEVPREVSRFFTNEDRGEGDTGVRDYFCSKLDLPILQSWALQEISGLERRPIPFVRGDRALAILCPEASTWTRDGTKHGESPNESDMVLFPRGVAI